MTRRLLLPLVVVVLALVVPTSAMAAPAEQRRAERALTKAKRVLDGRGVRTGREASVVLKELAVRLSALDRADRREARKMLARPEDPNGDPPFGGYDPSSTVITDCSLSTVFCFHWVEDAGDPDRVSAVDTSPSNGTPDYVDEVAAVMAQVRAVENGTQTQLGQLAWRTPVSDATALFNGGNGKSDVYLRQLGDQDIFGYAAPDPAAPGDRTRSGYLVLDNDYLPSEYGGRPSSNSLRVTAAHEYNHVLQYAYDSFADDWMFEATAVWMEDKVFDGINDYVSFLVDRPSGPGWRSLTDVPLTEFDSLDDPRFAKPYGSSVWNLWLEARWGPGIVENAWELSPSNDSFAPAAYADAIRARGGSGFSGEFDRFAATTAEWRARPPGFPEGNLYPDVRRFGTMATNSGRVLATLDNTSYVLADVSPTSASRIKLIGHVPAGTPGALALVGRRGAASTTGPVTTRLVELPNGGAGAVVLDSPGLYPRIAAALINGGPSRNDQTFSAFISTDFSAPSIVSRAPAEGAQKASTKAPVTAIFSEPVSGVSGSTFQLTDEAGAAVAARVTYDAGSRTATLTPSEPLEDTTLYTARLTSGIRDASLNAFAGTTWRFRTVRLAPRLKLSVPRSQRAKLVKRRGVLATLSSRDADKLKFTIALDGRAATTSARVGRKKGSLKAGRRARVRVRLKSAARRRLSRRSLRITLRVTLRDPQGNTRKLKRRLTVKR